MGVGFLVGWLAGGWESCFRDWWCGCWRFDGAWFAVNVGVVANFACFLIWWQADFTPLAGCGFGGWFCLVGFSCLGGFGICCDWLLALVGWVSWVWVLRSVTAIRFLGLRYFCWAGVLFLGSLRFVVECFWIAEGGLVSGVSMFAVSVGVDCFTYS